MKYLYAIVAVSSWLGSAMAADLNVVRVSATITKPIFDTAIWKHAKEMSVDLMGQPMVAPRADVTQTEKVFVRAVHDGTTLLVRLRWKDAEKSEAGPLGKFSDAAAMEFPVKDNANPPMVFMGEKDNPVHIFHWRAQYQKDKEQGKPEIKDIYPNAAPDIYPLEFKDAGSVKLATPEQRAVFAHGKAAGNPQSSTKERGIDEILAEGFGTSAVQESNASQADGRWAKGEWDLIIARPLKREGGSVLELGKASNVGFAIWQGGKDEVGARKSVTMQWVPVQIEK